MSISVNEEQKQIAGYIRAIEEKMQGYMLKEDFSRAMRTIRYLNRLSKYIDKPVMLEHPVW